MTRPTLGRRISSPVAGISDRPRKCLVIAAGRGHRLASDGLPKPLFRLLGLPLIERAIVTGKRAGLEEFTVVTGYDAFLLFGLTWHVFAAEGSPLVLGVGFLAITGSFLVSHTADKYDGLMKTRLERGEVPGFRIGRDLRVLVIALGAVFNVPYLALESIERTTAFPPGPRPLACQEDAAGGRDMCTTRCGKGISISAWPSAL